MRHVYFPTLRPEQARRSELDHVIQTHFSGSVSQAIAALLESSAESLTDRELQQIGEMMEEAKKAEALKTKQAAKSGKGTN